MKKKLLLGSCIDQVIGKMGFLFEKPLEQLKFICITTAANVYEGENRIWLYDEMKAFTDLGIELVEFDIQGKTSAEVAEKILNADAVYVTGGNTYYLMEHMQKCNFKSVIMSYLEVGGLYIGSSAGSVAACPTIDFIRDMDEPAKADLIDNTGLGLLDLNIMPHIDHIKHGPIARKIIGEQKDSKVSFLGLRDNQAILITDNYMEVY